MIDIVFPDSNEKEFVGMAKRLGYSGICFVYHEKDRKNLVKAEALKETGFNIFTGLVCKKLPKAKADIYFAEKNDRFFLKGKHDVIFDIEGLYDFIHQRDSGLNHILCRMMHEKEVSYGISFSAILNSEKRSVLLGQIMQNVRLCQKYKTKIIFASFAEHPFKMRSPNDLEAFGRILGLRNAKKVLNAAASVVKTKQRQIGKDIERI
ncbi:MAG: hypothetical protein KAT43_01830 [Nanoarchaeota archaeon]|nr:hypothetical protein [Nanoarchaeota archaeon]